MIHNKYFYIIKEFLGDYSKEIYGRNLIGKVSLSQKNIALTLGELEKKGILRSIKEGNIKYFKLNLNNSNIKDIIIITEIIRKINFLDIYRKIANVFDNDNRIIGIFGSYAKGNEKVSSDIDIFIIGNKKGKDYKKIGDFYDLNLSIKYFSEKTFKNLIKNENGLCKEIINDHIIIFGVERFTNIIWRNYYGFH